MRELEEESGLLAREDSLEKVGTFHYEFSDTTILPFVMQVRDISHITLRQQVCKYGFGQTTQIRTFFRDLELFVSDPDPARKKEQIN